MITLKRLTIPALKHLRDVDLWLPRRGATLIEGPNESGKSTLFEAVYFALYGRPLVGEEPGRATLAALIPHDGAQAQVALTVITGETELEIIRTLSRSRSGTPTSEAALIVRQPGRPEERINAVGAVNDRILAELRGLDGDTLRNSCFMEQKGLERLESLRRDEREEAISRLLGLERLVSIERALAPSADDRRHVERLRAQTQVARHRRLLREAAEREGDAALRLQAAEVREWLDERDSLVARLETLVESDQRRSEELAEQEALLARLDHLRAIQRRLAETERVGWRTRQTAQETSQLTTRLEHLTDIEETQAPDAQRRLGDIYRLESALREVTTERSALNEADALLQTVQAAEAAQRQARVALAEADRHRSAASLAVARARARDTLAEWILARERADVRQGGTQRLAALNLERGQYVREISETRAQAWQWLALTSAAVAMAAISGALALAVGLPPLWFIAALSAVGAVALGLRWRGEVSSSRARKWQLSQADLGISSVRAEVNLVRRLVNDDIGRLEASLRAAGLPIPPTAEDGERILRDLPRADNLAAIEAQATDAEARAARARVEMERAAGEGARAEVALRHLFSGTPEQLRQRLASADATMATLIAEARSLDLPESVDGLTAARGAAEMTVTTLLASANSRDEVHTQLLESNGALDEMLRTWASELQGVARELAALGLAEEYAPTDPLDAQTLEALHEELSAQTHQALAHDDEAETRARLAGLIAEHERLAAKTDELRERRQRLCELIHERMQSLGLEAHGDESLAALADLWPVLGEVNAAELARLRAEREDARLEAYHSEQTAAERERELTLESATLDEDTLRERLESAERELRRRELAARLAEEARARIIRRALPETEVYMRAILPELTAGRYHDITLLRDDASGGGDTDLAIRMWDQIAGRYVRKNLFSGGTRDQASLALRLAFALATLPKEHGAMPGFIFLDEPLSAFDAERSLALARVLTTGAIASAFAQVFLISHSQVIESRMFDYTLRMDGGRVVESTLPDGALAEALWEAEEQVGSAEHISASA